MRHVRTRVAIVGTGPAGLFLSHRLMQDGIPHVVVGHRDEAAGAGFAHTGFLAPRTLRLLRTAGLTARLDRRALVQDGFEVRSGEIAHRFSTMDLVGAPTVMYGRQELVRDVLAARTDQHGETFFGVTSIRVGGVGGISPTVWFKTADGGEVEVVADFVAGCDSFHDMCRTSAGADAFRKHDREFPFWWLAVAVETPPISREMIYATHERGFALQCMRTDQVSSFCLQVRPGTDLADWPDDRILAELRTRLRLRAHERLQEGRVLERSLQRLHGFTSEPMQHGRLFLAGDAAHVFPPSAAKGLNAALTDAATLADAFAAWFRGGRRAMLDDYSATRLPVVWRVREFSEWLTWLLHTSPDTDGGGVQLRAAQLRQLVGSRRSAAAFAERYTGVGH